MEWINSILIEHSVIQAVVVIAMISALGLALGKISVYGVSLGVTFVFFVGIAAGHFGLSIDPQMLNYAESFGLIIFVYALGLQVGVIADSKYVLTGEYGEGSMNTCLYSGQKNFVELYKTALANEIKLLSIREENRD